MQVNAVAPQDTRSISAQQSNALDQSFGLSFEELLKIVLNQLTYQDPLKPLENFEFVSQLAQFTQIQQGQTINDGIDALVNQQARDSVVSILGQQVDIIQENGIQRGEVKSVTFTDQGTRMSVLTADQQLQTDIPSNLIHSVVEGAS
ncbi:flagellar hook capping FlgD N-terminal domain-containing protein [Woodsholea maritima]|uniref:flagellar hook capping FlgD N-terminal domain-containing protein n=1 Tax=Woodsholea maritima TaxID=240237 RepID=UPI00038277E9|nr:flagellar hook capping FlgD N-terminal domain-containing protein [Woodsholea maritima]